MSDNLPKYRFVNDDTFKTFEDKLNTLAEAGYRVNSFQIGGWPDELTQYYAIMSLKADSKYENISNLRDVSPGDVDGYLADGWIITDTYSKFVRMVRPLKKDLNNKPH